jgi:hypothetical protein
MKEKRMTLILMAVALSVLMITPVFANGNGNGNHEYESKLVVGRKEVQVGIVTIEVDGADLIINYITDCDLVETHIWVGDDLADMPKTNSGNPKIGHFPYSADSTGEAIIDISGLSGNYIYLAIHAVVDCPCKGEETAWGQGCYATRFADDDMFGNRWGFYITIPN